MSENVKPWSPGYRSETVQTAKMSDSLVQSLPFKGPSNLAEWLGWFSGLMVRHLGIDFWLNTFLLISLLY